MWIGIVVDARIFDSRRCQFNNAIGIGSKVTGQIADNRASAVNRTHIVVGNRDGSALPKPDALAGFIAKQFIDHGGHFGRTLDGQPPDPQLGGEEMTIGIVTRQRISTIELNKTIFTGGLTQPRVNDSQIGGNPVGIVPGFIVFGIPGAITNQHDRTGLDRPTGISIAQEGANRSSRNVAKAPRIVNRLHIHRCCAIPLVAAQLQ